MDTIELCNQVRIEAEGISNTGFPLDVFPEKIKQIILDLAKRENYMIEYSAVCFLSAIATALGNTYLIRIKGDWICNAALYIILVGRPGLGKTPPLNAAYAPIRKADYQRLLKYKAELEQSKESDGGKKDSGEKKNKPVLIRTIVSDFTPEALMRAHDDNQRGVVILVDEIMGMFNTVNQYSNGQLIEQLLTAFSGGALNIIRVNNPIPIHIARPCINIIGGTQTKLVGGLFKKGYEDNGFLDRMLLVKPKSQKISLWEKESVKEVENSPSPIERWEVVVNKVLALDFDIDEATSEKKSKTLNFSEDAMEYFFDWRNNIVRSINAIEDDAEVNSRPMKRELVIARLSLIFQVMRWASNESHLLHVDINSVKSAIRMSDYFEECFNSIKNMVSDDELEEQSKDMFQALPNDFKTQEAITIGYDFGISRRSIYKKLSDFAAKNLIKKISFGHYKKVSVNHTNENGIANVQ